MVPVSTAHIKKFDEKNLCVMCKVKLKSLPVHDGKMNNDATNTTDMLTPYATDVDKKKKKRGGGGGGPY